jgi:hypothetical protein
VRRRFGRGQSFPIIARVVESHRLKYVSAPVSPPSMTPGYDPS